MSRVPKMPEIPVAAITSALTATAAVAGIGWAGYHGIYSVSPGQKAIKFNRLKGVLPEVIHEGTHFLIPWLERPIIFDVRTRPRAIKSTTGTRDLQMVDIGLRVLTKPDPAALPVIYRRLGMDFDDKVLPSIITEVVKQVIAQFNATSLLTQREQVSRKIKDLLSERAREFSILLEDVSITDLKFGREFELAVERKQVAQQDAERARFIVDMAQQDKLSIIIKAQGEATSAEMIGKAAAENPGFVQLRRIDAAREVAQTLAAGSNSVYLPSDSLLLNLVGSVDSSVAARKLS